MTEFISVKQMAKKLNISLDTAYNLTQIQEFPVIVVGRMKRIPVDRLEKWLEKRLQK